MSLNALDAAAVLFTRLCRSGTCPLLDGATPSPRPDGCPVSGDCANAGLMAWTATFHAGSPAATTCDATATEDGAMLIGIKEVSALLGISVSSIQRLARAQRFPQPVRMLGSLVRWRRADILAFASGTPSSAPQEQEERRLRRGGRPKGATKRTLEKEAWRKTYGPNHADK